MGDATGCVSSARSGMRVEAAIQRMAFGKTERAKGIALLPRPVTIARESNVARDIPRLSCARRVW